MTRRDNAMILASTYVIALVSLGGCVAERSAPTPSTSRGFASPVASPVAAPTAPTTVVDDNWCGEVIPDRDALHALVEARIAEHDAKFAACAPAQRERSVVRAEISLNVCGRASLGTATPDVPFTPTEQC